VGRVPWAGAVAGKAVLGRAGRVPWAGAVAGKAVHGQAGVQANLTEPVAGVTEAAEAAAAAESRVGAVRKCDA